MPRSLVTILAVSLACAMSVHADEVGPVLARELPRLGDPSYSVRAAAHQAILALGPAAEDAVRAALAASEDVEVQARLHAILQSYTIATEEAYALWQVDRDEPFPDSAPVELSTVGLESVQEWIEHIAARTGLRWHYYPGDPTLERRARLAGLEGAGFQTTGGAGSTQRALMRGLNQIDATHVIDAGRVVVVRLSPAVFFRRLERQTRAAGQIIPLQTQAEWTGVQPGHWMTLKFFLQAQRNDGGAPRQKWFELLAVTAAGGPPDQRGLALRGLACFLGMDDEPELAVEELLERHCDPAHEPDAAVRAEALGGLVRCVSPAAQARALQVLERGPEEDRRVFLERLYTHPGSIHVYSALEAGNAERARLGAALAELARNGSDVDLRLRAACLLAQRTPDDAGAERLAAWEPEPARAGSLAMFLDTLSRASPASCRARLDRYATSDTPWVRGLYIQLTAGASAGCGLRPDRAADAGVALAGLSDPDSLVRRCAVDGLSCVYSRNAKPYEPGLSAARAALVALSARETDAPLRSAIDRALELEMLSEPARRE